MKKLLTLVLTLSLFSALAQQKDMPFEKDLFKDRKDEFKTAKKAFEAGEEFFKQYQFDKAEVEFDKAYAFNPNYSKLNYYLGMCVLNSSYKFKALNYFKKAYELNPNVAPEINLLIGIGYHINGDWDNGIKHYEYHKKVLNPKNTDTLEYINKKISECKTGKDLVAKPKRVWVDNLGKNVNTEFPEYGPFISADESVIIYTGRRSDTRGGKKDEGDGKFFEDIYLSKRNPKNGEWEKAINIGENINTENHDAPSGLSPDGKLLYIFYGWKGGGDIYQSKLKDGQYGKPEKLSSNVSSKYYESSASVSFDGKELYFASERPGGFGGEDIYVSRWDEKKKEWGPAENLGANINTKYRETGVFLHPDGETMYFSSQGHSTMGGFDIFMSKRDEKGVWGAPVNIGYPINSPDDDVFFVVSGSGRYGYYSSFRQDGYGEKDLYRITFLGPEKPPIPSTEDNLIASLVNPVREIVIEPKVEVSTVNLAILKGIIRDARTLQPLEAKLELIDNDKNELVTTLTSDSKSGAYLVTIPAGKNYGISVKAEGYLFHSENVDIPKASGYKEYEKNVDLKKVEVGQTIVLRNIFFDYDKATLRDASRNELERLIKLLNENPTLRIEISGHTDTQGDATYNQKLSENRAKAVVEYLVRAGISASRLEYKGYGESKTQISEADILKMKTKTEREDAHQQNRRTEFKILSK
ncbi:MAG TPA: OmpA family protein [Flavobacteriales bacterium]|nr:OmpA family protein [Flavobacteriales bacterium]HRJ39196.1 OmpA family protein [Flavobacteriales bacterium]